MYITFIYIIYIYIHYRGFAIFLDTIFNTIGKQLFTGEYNHQRIVVIRHSIVFERVMSKLFK